MENKIRHLILFLLLTSCATTGNKVDSEDKKNPNRFSVEIPDVTEKKKPERFIKKFLGKRDEVFVEFLYSNRGKYKLVVTRVPDSLLNIEHVKATLSIENSKYPAVVTFANDGDGNLSSFGPYLMKGSELKLKLIFMDEKVELDFNFRL